MPNRIVRDGILRSKAVGRLDPLAQLFYRCLHSVADDFGRYYADTEVLLSDCFPLRPKWATEELLAQWLMQCEQEKLIKTYGVGGSNYLEIQKFGQRIRPGAKSKFPPPAESSGVQPLFAADFGHKPASAAERGSRAASPAPPTPSATPPTTAPPPAAEENADEYTAQFTAAVRRLGYADPDGDVAAMYNIAKVAEVCESAGAVPALGAAVVVDLLKTHRCRGKPLDYLLAAVRGKLAPNGENRSALRKANFRAVGA